MASSKSGKARPLTSFSVIKIWRAAIFSAAKSLAGIVRSDSYAAGNSVATQLAMIDVGPLDFVAETLARAAVLLQLANPSAHRLERMAYRLCLRATHRKIQWKQRFAGDAGGKDFAALPHAQHLLAQIARRSPRRCISHRIQPAPSAGPRQALCAIFLDRQVTQHGPAAFIVVDKAHRGDEGLDDVDLLQRSDDKELQAEPLEQLQSVTRGLIRPAPERFVNQHEAKRP